MIKHLLVFTLLFVALFSKNQAKAMPSAGQFGLGLALFEPTGVAVKYMLSDTQAVSGALGWHWYGINLHADYQLGVQPIAEPKHFSFFFNYGVGLQLASYRGWSSGSFRNVDRRYRAYEGSTNLGLRFPLALNFYFRAVPIDVAIELSPTLNITPVSFVSIESTLLVRYYF